MTKLLILLLLIPSFGLSQHKDEIQKKQFAEISDDLLMCYTYYGLTSVGLSRNTETPVESINLIKNIQDSMLITVKAMTAISHISDKAIDAKIETMRTIIMEEIDYDFTNLSVATLKWGGECNVLTQELMGLIKK